MTPGGSSAWISAGDLLPVGARREAHVDAVELAQAAEAPLRGGDVGSAATPRSDESTPATLSGTMLCPDDQMKACRLFFRPRVSAAAVERKTRSGASSS